MSPVFDGPVELVMAIFSIAALEERSTALSLVCVCKAVRKWIIPIIYGTVELDNPSTFLFEKMLTMPSSSSASFVRHLRTTCLPNVDLLSKHCREIQAMTIANYDIRHLTRLRLPLLTHLTIGGSLRYSHFSSSMTALATVTHLRFPNDIPRLSDNILSAIPNLTHFLCCYNLSKKSQHRELVQCLRTVTMAPTLRVAVVFVPSRDRKGEDAISQVLGVDERRIVVVPSVEVPNETEHVSPTDDVRWSVAEDKLRRRALKLSMKD